VLGVPDAASKIRIQNGIGGGIKIGSEIVVTYNLSRKVGNCAT
jgi:hypothetical protein